MEDPKPVSEKSEILEEVLGFDVKKFWFTFKELTYKPGETIAGYCDGNRSKLIKPITYFVILWGLSYFLTVSTGVMDNAFNSDQPMVDETNSTDRSAELMQSFQEIFPDKSNAVLEKMALVFTKSSAFITSQHGMLLIFIPVFVPFMWLFFKRYRKPFVHHLYFYLYTSAQVNIITLPLVAIVYFFPAASTVIIILMMLVSLAYFYYAEYIFYSGISVAQLMIRNVLSVLALIIPAIIWFMIILILTMIVYWII